MADFHVQKDDDVSHSVCRTDLIYGYINSSKYCWNSLKREYNIVNWMMSLSRRLHSLFRIPAFWGQQKQQRVWTEKAKGVVCGPGGAQLADNCALTKLRKCHLFLPGPIHACPCHGPWTKSLTAKTCRGAKRFADALNGARELRQTTPTETSVLQDYWELSINLRK
jgi:hypothetical protein